MIKEERGDVLGDVGKGIYKTFATAYRGKLEDRPNMGLSYFKFI